jgi:hypothetical protein
LIQVVRIVFDGFSPTSKSSTASGTTSSNNNDDVDKMSATGLTTKRRGWWVRFSTSSPTESTTDRTTLINKVLQVQDRFDALPSKGSSDETKIVDKPSFFDETKIVNRPNVFDEIKTVDIKPNVFDETKIVDNKPNVFDETNVDNKPNLFDDTKVDKPVDVDGTNIVNRPSLVERIPGAKFNDEVSTEESVVVDETQGPKADKSETLNSENNNLNSGPPLEAFLNTEGSENNPDSSSSDEESVFKLEIQNFKGQNEAGSLADDSLVTATTTKITITTTENRQKPKKSRTTTTTITTTTMTNDLSSTDEAYYDQESSSESSTSTATENRPKPKKTRSTTTTTTTRTKTTTTTSNDLSSTDEAYYDQESTSESSTTTTTTKKPRRRPTTTTTTSTKQKDVTTSDDTYYDIDSLKLVSTASSLETTSTTTTYPTRSPKFVPDFGATVPGSSIDETNEKRGVVELKPPPPSEHGPVSDLGNRVQVSNLDNRFPGDKNHRFVNNFNLDQSGNGNSGIANQNLAGDGGVQSGLVDQSNPNLNKNITVNTVNLAGPGIIVSRIFFILENF